MAHPFLNRNAPLTNESHDSFVKGVEGSLLPVLKDADEKIKYLKVLSQDDFNESTPDNETLYFINNINDDPLSLNNILDIAVSHTSRDSLTPEFIWMLTGDSEMEIVYLYKMPLASGKPELVKVFDGYIRGSITFDGTYEYTKDYSQTTLITKDEPFIALINTSGELYVFPSLKYQTVGKGKVSALFVDGGSGREVQACSVDKGYCSERFKGSDQGIVIAYSINDGGGCTLRYTQYGYADDDSTFKGLSGVNVNVVTKDTTIFNVIVRRLSDYRLGLTYNYWDTVNGETVSKAEFRYSKRIYAGVAYHPELIDISELPTISNILYTGHRNDNHNTIPKPVLQLIEKPRTLEKKEIRQNGLTDDSVIEFVYGLTGYAGNMAEEGAESQEVDLEIINPDNPKEMKYQFQEGSTLENYLGWAIKSDWPWENYKIDRDPSYGTTYPVPTIKKVIVEGKRIKLLLEGDSVPPVPFRIVTNSKWGEQINVRYRGDRFQGHGINAGGWFALEDFEGSVFGDIKQVGKGLEQHAFQDFSKSLCNQMVIKMTTANTESKPASFEKIEGFNYSTSQDYEQIEVESVDSGLSAYFQINSISGHGFCEAEGVANINV